MSISILMPALSPTMEEGNLTKWLKNEGDQVNSGDVIAEIETDKATMEVEATDEGVLGKILVAAGTEGVKVNTVIALLAEEGEDPASLTPPAAPEAKAAPAPAAAPAETPAAKAPGASAAPAAPSSAGRIFASPLARRLAKEAGLDLASLKGSGPRGRVIAKDIAAAKAGGTAKLAASPAPASPTKAVMPLAQGQEVEEIKLDGMRKIIAARLTESKQNVPHFYLSVDCRLDNLLRIRSEANAASPKEGPEAYKISVNDFVIKAMAAALIRVPAANAIWAGDKILRYSRADVGVAVAIEGGLFTPVIRSADLKSLIMISNEMKDLAARARARKLAPEEYQGGTTSVSNLGMFGIKSFSAVINPPQSTILAVGAGEPQAIAVGDKLEVATIMSATLSCDHRVVDGAVGAELLATFKQLIENPISMLV